MRILSGIQPSGKLHIGNYLGAMRQHLDLQDKGEAFYFIADLHALTSITDAETLRRNVHTLAVDLLALGLDPARTVALETLFDPSRRRVLMTTPVTQPAMRVVVKLAGPEAPIACPFARTAALHRLATDFIGIGIGNATAGHCQARN